jgi:hypothetical protein
MKANFPHYQFSLVSHRKSGHTLIEALIGHINPRNQMPNGHDAGVALRAGLLRATLALWSCFAGLLRTLHIPNAGRDTRT